MMEVGGFFFGFEAIRCSAQVPYEEDGAGQGGYAKEMSDEYKAAEQAMLTDEVAKADVVITTALIPGRKAPVLIPEAMVAGMKRGSVIVDMASVNGGNVVGTVDGQKVVTSNGVSILGYSDLPSRLPTAASQLFGRNQANFLLSVGPQTTGTKGEFLVDYEDPAVRGMLVVDGGRLTWPAPPYEPPPAPKQAVGIRAEIYAVEQTPLRVDVHTGRRGRRGRSRSSNGHQREGARRCHRINRSSRAHDRRRPRQWRRRQQRGPLRRLLPGLLRGPAGRLGRGSRVAQPSHGRH